ncbi:MAG: hypothetical protein AB7O62_26110 [Pirellulales bacterium]
MNLQALLQDKTPAERRKLALLALLAVLFVVVLYWQFAGAGGSPAAADLAVARPPRTVYPAAIPESHGTARRDWPTADLSETIAHNPFRMPAQFIPPPEPEQVVELDEQAVAAVEQAQAEPIEEQLPAVEPPPFQWPVKVQAVFVDARGAAAMVDSRVVRVGDRLESGARVIEIAPGHVMLQRD